MPTIPRYDELRVAASGAPTPYVTDGGAAAQTAGIGARQLQEAGAATMGAGNELVRIAIDAQKQADAVRVNDAMNRARQAAIDLAYNPESGYLNLKGAAALQRPDGQPLPEEYGSKLRTQIDSIVTSLGNDTQRREFLAQSQTLATTFSSQVQQHMLQEFKSHALSVQDGAITLAGDEAKRNWTDPAAIDPALQRAQAAVVEKGRLLGWSGNETQAALLVMSSKVHTDVILEALANGNPVYAQSYLEKRKAGMTADDILKVQGHVNQQVWAGMSQQAVQTATSQAIPKFAPTAFDRMVTITLQSESGGRDFGADGALLTSPKGAKGRMQVLDSTLAKPGLPGVQPLDPKTATPDQRAKFGEQYLQALLQRYGDPAKAWAAYNAGFGAVDKALAEAKAEAGQLRGPLPADYWLGKLPAETQAYVAKNVQALVKSGGVPPRPTELEFVNQALAALPPGSPPQVVQRTRERAVQQFGTITKSMNETADNALSAAQRWVSANPGATLDQIPPQLIDPLRQFAPGKLDDLAKYSQALQAPEVKTDLTVYNRLVANPELLRRMSDAEFEMMRTRLAPADFKHLAGERAAMLNPKPGEMPGNADFSAVTAAVNEHLRALRIDPSPKDDGGADAARVGAIRKFVNDEVLRAQALTGKKFNAAEVRQTVGRLFAEQGTVSRWFAPDLAQSMLTMQIGDIPSATLKSLKADFSRMGIDKPTDAQLLGAYWTTRHLAAQARR